MCSSNVQRGRQGPNIQLKTRFYDKQAVYKPSYSRIDHPDKGVEKRSKGFKELITYIKLN